MKDYTKAFNTILNKLKNNENFAFTRFSDGELFILQNKKLVLAENHYITGDITGANKYTEEEQKYFNPEKDGALRSRLIESFKHNQDNYYKGICTSSDAHVGKENFEWMVNFLGGDHPNLTYANLLINANYKRFVEELIPIFSKREIIYVVNKLANVNNLPFSREEINSMPREEFDSFINSQKAELKFFEDSEGNTITARVNKDSGLIENPNFGKVPFSNANTRWVKAENMGLLPRDPITTSKVFNMNNEVNEQLLRVGLDSYTELTDAAKLGNQAISSGTVALNLVDDMYSGMAAGAKLGLDRIGKLLADATGVEYDASKIASTEEFVINRLQEMANFIQKLGSGTGLSDNDAKIAMQAVAGDKTLDRKTLMNVITQYIQSGQFAVEQFNEATNILSKDEDLSRQDLIRLNSLRMQVFQPKTTKQRVDEYLGRTK